MAVLGLSLAGVFVLRGFGDSDVESSSELVLGRSVGEVATGRAVGSPSEFGEAPSALAFASTDVSQLTESIARSAAFDEADLVAFRSLRQAVESSTDVCQGVPRPTSVETIVDTRAFRITQDEAIADVRITEFESGTVVDRVLQASRSAWESCDGKPNEFGSTVNRSVMSFSSLSGTPGVNLRSELIDASGATVSSSQTLAIPAVEVLIEVRIVVPGELDGQIDPVQILDDVEALI